MLASLLLSALAASAHPSPVRRQTGSGNYIIATPGSITQCFATLGGAADGTLVGFLPCNQVQTTNSSAYGYGAWMIMPGNQLSVQLVGTNFCLDAGLNPGSMPVTAAKVWTCYPGLAQQQFYYTGDNHIAVTDYTPCLELDSGGANFVQCTSTPANGAIQAFTTVPVSGGTPSASMSSSAPSSTPTPPATGQYIYWPNGATATNCLTVTNGQFYNGSPVGIAPCANMASQMWVYSEPGVTSLQVAGQNYCIDFGTGGGMNGTPMKIWTCYPGLFQQTMYWTTDDHIAVYNGNQCLDVQAGTMNVQSWQCSGPDVNQLWTSE